MKLRTKKKAVIVQNMLWITITTANANYDQEVAPQAPIPGPAVPPSTPNFGPNVPPPPIPNYGPDVPPQPPSYGPDVPPQPPTYGPAAPPPPPFQGPEPPPAVTINQYEFFLFICVCALGIYGLRK
jgi:hypothetical protein